MGRRREKCFHLMTSSGCSNRLIIDSDNDWLVIPNQAVSWKKAVVLPVLLNFETKWDRIQHNAFQNVIVKMSAILFRHRYLLMWLLTIWYVYLDWNDQHKLIRQLYHRHRSYFEESYTIVNAESGKALLLACVPNHYPNPLSHELALDRLPWVCGRIGW